VKSNFQVFPTNIRGIDFMGYRFFHGYTLVRKRIVKQMKLKLNNEKSMASYWGWLKHADAFNLTNKYFNNERKSKHATGSNLPHGRKEFSGTLEYSA
jgi:RNA-directed DNA polymerase